MNVTKQQLALYRKNIEKEKLVYETRKENFVNLQEKLEKDFEANLVNSLSDKEKEVFDEGDIIEINTLLNQKRKVAIDDIIEKERDALEKQEDTLEEQEDKLDDLEAEDKFKEANPDIDTEGFKAYIDPEKGKLTPFERKEFYEQANGDKVKFLGLVAQAFLESTGTTPPKKAKLPTDVKKVAGATGDIDDGKNNEDEDSQFMASIGLN